MTVAVSISRTDLDAAGLRRAASRTSDGNAARRMLALALVLDGRTRTEAAEQCGMDRQTLRDWVHRYNAHGLAGLSDRRPPGGKPRLTPEQSAEVARLVGEGPALADARRGALAADRPFAGDRGALRRASCRAQRRRAAAPPRVSPPVGAAAPSRPGRRGAGGIQKRMARPVCKRFLRSDPSSLRQRIRPVGVAPAKMEIRASRSS